MNQEQQRREAIAELERMSREATSHKCPVEEVTPAQRNLQDQVALEVLQGDVTPECTHHTVEERVPFDEGVWRNNWHLRPQIEHAVADVLCGTVCAEVEGKLAADSDSSASVAAHPTVAQLRAQRRGVATESQVPAQTDSGTEDAAQGPVSQVLHREENSIAAIS